MLCDSTLSQPIPVFWSTSRTFRRKWHWSCIAREDIDSERIYRVPQPRREREWIEFNDEKQMNSRRKQHQKRKTSGLLPYSEPDRNSTRSDESKDRVIQEYLETLSKYSISVQFEARPRREVCNFTKRGHMQSFSTTHCLQLELRSRVYKNYGWVLPESSLNFKCVTSRVKIVFAIWSACKIHKTKTQDHRGSHQATRKVSGKLGTTP